MRVLIVITAGEERLWNVASELGARGHDVTICAEPGAGKRAGTRVYEGVWRGWRAAYAVGRLLARWNVEIAVAEDPRALGVLRWARLFHRSVALSGAGGADGETVERELEAVRTAHHRYGRAVFLDRDGTLMPEIGALGPPEAVRLMPGVASALRALAAARYELVVISNQSAIGRGAVTVEQVRDVNAALRRALRAEGVELSGIFVCPHRPEDGCDCRKPLPGLLHQAARGLGISLARSWRVGDSTRETQAAAAAGVRGILLQTGWGGADPAAPGGGTTYRQARSIEAAAQAVLHG